MVKCREVVVLVGSLRQGSFSRKLAEHLRQGARGSLRLEIVEIGHLPHYDQDRDDFGPPPPEWVSFRERMRQADAVLFVTPEYNRSVPGVLKNAIDIGSRPYGQSVWDGKPAAVLSTSTGSMGGFGANHHLRQALVFLNMPVLQQPEAYVGGTGHLFRDDGSVVDPATDAFLNGFMTAFGNWTGTILAAAEPRELGAAA